MTENVSSAQRPAPRPLSSPGARWLGVSVAGLGSYLPPATITNSDLKKLVETSDEWIVSRTGIHSRHRAAPEQATSDLALPAAREALAQARLGTDEIDLILVATATPDSPVPPTACVLQRELGATNAVAFDVSAACSGFLFAMHTATGLIRSGMHKNALVIGAETLTRMTDYTDRSTCVLFGDGAGAAVLGTSGYLDLLYSSIGSDGRGAELISVPAGGSRLPASQATVAERMHCLRLKGQEVFRRAVQTMTKAGCAALDALGLAKSDIAWIVPHQANLRITQAVAAELGLPPERVIQEIGDVGNTSAASLPIALKRLEATGRLAPGDRVMLVGFGAGLTWGCQVFVRTDSPV